MDRDSKPKAVTSVQLTVIALCAIITMQLLTGQSVTINPLNPGPAKLDYTGSSGGGGTGATGPAGAAGAAGATGATGATGPFPSNPFTSVDGGCSYLTQTMSAISCTVPYTKWSSIAATSGSSGTLFVMPANFAVTSCAVEVPTGFTSSGNITALTVAAGTAATPSGYGTAYAVMPTPTPPLQEWPCAGVTLQTTIGGTQTIILTAAVTNTSPANLTTLTAGSVTFTMSGFVRR